MGNESTTVREILRFYKNFKVETRKSKKNDRKKRLKTVTLPAFTSHPPGNEYIEKIFRLPLGEDRCKLNITGINGNIILTGYEGDMVCAKIMYKPKTYDATIMFTSDKTGKYFLTYDKENFDSVWAEIYVPARFFREIRIKANNGKVLVSGISAGLLLAACAGCELKNTYAANLRVESNKRNAYLQNVSAMQGKVSLSGGRLHAVGLDVKELELSAQNGNVALAAKCERHMDYKWNLNCSDGKLNIDLPEKQGLGYYILAQSRVSGVKMALKNMDILMSGHNFIEAKSQKYDISLKKIYLKVDALRAPIDIQ